MPARKSSSPVKSKKMASKNEETFMIALGEYSDAMKVFHERDWERSRKSFDAFVAKYDGNHEASELVDRARCHGTACEARLSPESSEPSSGSEWLMHGIARANDGDCDEALDALEQAASLGAPEPKVRYVRAAALAVASRNDEAIEELARAIDLDPDNRAFSLGDPDFERLREMAGYVALVEPPNREPAGTAGGGIDAGIQGTTELGHDSF